MHGESIQCAATTDSHPTTVDSTLELSRLPWRILKSPGWAASVVLFLADIVLIYGVLVAGQTAWFQEDALMENVQAGAMALAAIGLAMAIPRVGGLDRCLVAVFALTCFAFFLREVDVEDQNVPQFLVLLGSGLGRDLLISVAYIVLGIHFFKRFRNRLREMPLILRSRIAQVVILGCVFLALGAVFEPLELMFWEELVEFNGALLILWAAVICMRNPRGMTREMKSGSDESSA